MISVCNIEISQDHELAAKKPMYWQYKVFHFQEIISVVFYAWDFWKQQLDQKGTFDYCHPESKGDAY